MDRRDHTGTKIAVIAPSLIIFSVLSFGAVEMWSATVLQVSVLSLCMFQLIVRRAAVEESETVNPAGGTQEKLLFISLALLFGFLAVQMIPFPQAVLEYLSPRSSELYSFYAVDVNAPGHISLHVYRTQVEFSRMATYAAFFVLLAYSMRDRHAVEKMLMILAYFGFGLAIFAILQKAAWNGKIYWIRDIPQCSPFGPFLNRNHYAGLMGMLVPLTLGLAFTRRRRERQLLFGFFGVIMSVSLFLSLSRAGIVSFLVGISVFALFFFWKKFKAKKIWALASFLLVVFLYLLYIGIDPVIDRFYRTDITREARIAVWAETLRAFSDFSLTGSGLGTFLDVFQLYSPEPIVLLYDHAHNDYLEFILETGAIGGVLLLAVLILLMICITRGKWDGKTGFLKISFLSSIVTISVHSAFDFNLHIPSNALMLAAISGMAFANSRIGAESPEEP
ncbi:MAG: O-antigen ligase family protein [Nitrospirota bacterium]